MKKERLDYFKSLLSKITNQGKDWQCLVVRESPMRFDIFSGPPIDQAGAQAKLAAQVTGQRVIPLEAHLDKNAHQHVAHIHLTQPQWFEQNPNAVNDARFLVESPAIIRELMEALEKGDLS